MASPSQIWTAPLVEGENIFRVPGPPGRTFVRVEVAEHLLIMSPTAAGREYRRHLIDMERDVSNSKEDALLRIFLQERMLKPFIAARAKSEGYENRGNASLPNSGKIHTPINTQKEIADASGWRIEPDQ